MSDPNASAALQRALKKTGDVVTLQRVTGEAPNVVTIATAAVWARVHDLMPDPKQTSRDGLASSSRGSIEQNDRKVTISALDLAALGYPLPVARGDQVILPDSTEVLNVNAVDAYSRRYVAGVVLTVVGVS